MTETTLHTHETGQFEFSGGWLCLDFCNTADGDVNQTWTENLTRYADLVAWSHEAGVLNEEQAAHLLQTAARHPAEAARVLEAAIDLRFTIYEVFAAVAAARDPDPADLDALNAGLSHAMRHLQIVMTPDGFAWDWAPGAEPLEWLLWPVVRSAGDLLVSDRLHLIHECGGSNCSWLFVDTSRNHSRRWCDMKGCGNRAKARRHYERVRSVGE